MGAAGSNEIIEVVAIALSVAFVAGLVARAAGLPPIVGYLAAGALLSPHAPGYDADTITVQQVADLGVIFLMFGIGLRFRLRDLMAVRGLAVPGAIGQAAATTAAGTGAALLLGLPLRESVVVGLAISISSTVIIVRALTDRGLLGSIHGRVALGWTVVQDLVTVVILALLPALAPGNEGNLALEAAVSLGKAALFVVIMLVVGARLIPFALRHVGMYGSRELFVLAVVVSALGIAAGATLFDVSLALGAFVAGVAISETDTSAQAAADVVPLREAFAVLFFVGVGLLLDVTTLWDNLDLLAAVLAVVLLVNGLAAIVAVSLSSYPVRTAFVVAAAVSNVGEFSFVIVGGALAAGILSGDSYNVILGASVVTIAISRLVFAVHDRLAARVERLPILRRRQHRSVERPAPAPLVGHTVVAGYGRAGQLIVHALTSAGVTAIAIESDLGLARRANRAGVPAVWGDAANAEVLEEAQIATASLLVIVAPDVSTTRLALVHARRANPAIAVLARAHSRGEMDHLYSLGAEEVVVPEYEGGLELMERALTALGFDSAEALAFVHAQRDIHYGTAGRTRQVRLSGSG